MFRIVAFLLRQKQIIKRLSAEVETLRSALSQAEAETAAVSNRLQNVRSKLRDLQVAVDRAENVVVYVPERAERIINSHDKGWHKLLDKLETENRRLLAVARRTAHRGYERPTWDH